MAVQISGNDITVPRDTTVTRNLTVGGVLTYEDVTNVDSIGIVTARAGVLVGSGITLSKDGDIFATGISTFNGRVLIGTTEEGSADLDDLTIATSGNTGITIRSGTTHDGYLGFADGTSGNAQYMGFVRYDHNVNAMAFNTNDTERLRIYSNGAVLIGADSGEAGGDAKLAIDCEGMDIYDGVGDASNYGLIFANDPTGNKANGIGFFNDSASTCGGYIVHQDKGSGNIGDLVFGTSASSDTPVERLRISSAGNVGINQNNPQYPLHVTGTTSAARIACNDSASGIAALAVTNETNADLESVILTNRSSLGSSVNIPISFHTNGKTNEKMRMHTTGELSVPSGITLGLQADDKTASNTLDDYEEGTFVYTHASGGNVIVNATGRIGVYIKIGRTVHVWGQFATDTTGNYAVGTKIRIHDLPFATDSTNTPNAAGIITVNYQAVHQTQVGVVHISGTDELHGTVTATSGHSITGSGHYFQVSYMTAS